MRADLCTDAYSDASMFEEVLSRTLFELGLDLAQVNFIVQKRGEARASMPGGSRSRRAGTKAIAGVTASAANRAIA